MQNFRWKRKKDRKDWKKQFETSNCFSTQFDDAKEYQAGSKIWGKKKLDEYFLQFENFEKFKKI